MISSLPDNGRIDVIAKRAGDYLLRPPAWAPRKGVRVTRSGRPVTPEWGGPGLDYVKLNNMHPGETLTLVYPLVTFTQVTGHWSSKPDLKLTIRWKGNSVIDMTPKGTGLPIDFAHPTPIPALPSTEDR